MRARRGRRRSSAARPCAALSPPSALAWLVPGAGRGAEHVGRSRVRPLPPGRSTPSTPRTIAKAAALARDATAAYPEHVLAFYLLGQASLAQSRWEDAAQALAKVTALYPGRGLRPARPRRGLPAARAHRRGRPRLGGGARHPARRRRHPRAPGDHARQRQSAGAGPAPPAGARRAQHQAARRVPRDGARRLRLGRLRGRGGSLREGGGAERQRPDVVQPRRGARAPGQHGGRARGLRAGRPVPGDEGAGDQGDPEGARRAGAARPIVAPRPAPLDRRAGPATPPRGGPPAPRRGAARASSRSAR